jgi:hypothetical protein
VGRRSRKGRPVAESPATEPSLERGYARARERDAAVRADLVPLGPGERPTALVVASVVAGVLGILNLVLLAAGVEIDGRAANAGGVVVLSALLLMAAAGMWMRRYWAVLGFEALLGMTIAFAALSLLVASNVAAVALCLAIMGLGGWLFWKLVRVMGRLQVPTTRRRNEVR